MKRAAEEVLRIYGKGNREEINAMVKILNAGIPNANFRSEFSLFPTRCLPSAQQQALAACAHLKLNLPLAEPWVMLGPLTQPILVDEMLRDPANLLPLYLKYQYPSPLAQSKQIHPNLMRCVLSFFRVKSGSDRTRLEQVMGARRKGNLQVAIPADLSFRRSPTNLALFNGSWKSIGRHYEPHRNYNEPPPPYEFGSGLLSAFRLLHDHYNTIALVAESIPPSLKSGYAFQLFEVYEDRTLWAKSSLAKMPVRPADKVIEALLEKAKLDEISALRLTISLRCPLSMTRLVKPVRSHACRHVQCFDLETAQQLYGNNGSSIGRCPICQLPLPANSLFIDGLVQEVVAQVSPSVDEVILDLETGKWSIPANSEAQMVENQPSRKRTSLAAKPKTPKKSRSSFPTDPSLIVDLTGVDDNEPGNPIWDEPVPIKQEETSVVVLSDEDTDLRRPGASVFAAIVID